MPLLLKMHFGPRIRLRHFARWNTNPFKLEALDGFDPHTLPPSLPPLPVSSSSSSPCKLKPPGGSIMLQLHLSPRHSPCRPAPFTVFPPSGHVGVRQNGPTHSRRSPSDVSASSCPPSRHPAVGGVGLRRVTGGSFSSTLSYLMVFEDASGFLPPLLPTFLHAGAIFNRYIPCRPFFRAPASRRRTHCVCIPLQSIPQWYFVGGFPQMQLSFLFFSLL